MRLALILCILPLFAFAQGIETVSDRIARFESGVICPPPTIGTRPAPGTVAGTTNLIEGEPPFVALSRRVPAVIGIGFGVKAMSTAVEGLDNVTMRVTHPPMSAEGVTEQTFDTVISGAGLSLTFYQFDYDYELLIGTWTMTAMHEGEALYSTTFDVVPPRLVPELAAVCGFESLLS